MISIIITSYKEPETIKVALTRILDAQFGNLPDDCEIITVIPDDPTISAAKELIEKYQFKNWVSIKDPFLGKPNALNLAFKQAKGDIWILTDGDVYIEKEAISELMSVLETDMKVAGVSGRPICLDDRNTLFGYWGRLLTDVANKGRLLADKTSSPYLLSGYLFAVRKFDFDIPDGVLDDAYITYKLADLGFAIKYAPKAKVVVKYPSNLRDFINQKVRNLIGFKYTIRKIQLKDVHKQRSLFSELKYFFVPLQFARSPKELFYSLILYPVRAIVWVKSFYVIRYSKRTIGQIWQRIESTK